MIYQWLGMVWFGLTFLNTDTSSVWSPVFVLVLSVSALVGSFGGGCVGLGGFVLGVFHGLWVGWFRPPSGPVGSVCRHRLDSSLSQKGTFLRGLIADSLLKKIRVDL